jgi:hypothetical protein
MAEIQFERRGTPLWKVLLALLGLGGAGWAGYETFIDRENAAPTSPPAATVPQAPAARP